MERERKSSSLGEGRSREERVESRVEDGEENAGVLVMQMLQGPFAREGFELHKKERIVPLGFAQCRS